MPPLALVAPIVLPLGAGAVTAACGLAGLRVGRAIPAAGAWVAVVALFVLWVPVRSAQELISGPLGYGAQLDLRVDAVAFAFGLMVLVPSAVLLTLQPRSWQQSTAAALGVASAVLAVEAGGLLLTAFAGGTAATLAVIQLDVEDARAPRPSWGALLAAWLALSWAGGTLQVLSGTAQYSAVPVSQFTVPVFLLLAAAALMASGLLPWGGWPAKLWSRPSLRASGMAVATLLPLGFYLLVRAYEMGDGHYPHPALQALVAAIGVLVALGAAVRAQAALTRRDYLGELVPGLAGFALMAVGLGTPLGLVASVLILSTVAVMCACIPLLPDRAGPASLVATAAAVGLPPGLAFGALVLGLEATFEAGNLLGLIGIAAAATWLLSAVAASRSIGLPAGRGHSASETFPVPAMALAGLTLVAGPGLALLQSALALPVAQRVMTVPAGILSGSLTSVASVSTVVPSVSLFAPLLVLAVLAFAGLRFGAARLPTLPAVFVLPGAGVWGRIREGIRALAVPDQYRSIVDVRGLESAAAGGRPVLWLAVLAALALIVSR
jgi:hypothetical protein